MNQFEKAINLFNQAINVDKNYFHAYNNKGITLIKTQQVDQALWNFEKAIRINKTFSNNKGICLYKQKNLKEAIKCYDHAISINSNKSEYCVNKANSLGGLRQYEEAIELYSKVIKLDPNNDIAKQNQNTTITSLINHKIYNIYIQYIIEKYNHQTLIEIIAIMQFNMKRFCRLSYYIKSGLKKYNLCNLNFSIALVKNL